ncbi:Ser/Thr protein kinase [Cryptosporidium ryanae]|uniref:Ser/Thr protein kinase n=1 Tax=Cryptosporidium ryanae TaxID=515981 RepID=UPI003519F7EE|nr:Ser/Thr protein kinase [Cryptosporidium ryanae]
MNFCSIGKSCFLDARVKITDFLNFNTYHFQKKNRISHPNLSKYIRNYDFYNLTYNSRRECATSRREYITVKNDLGFYTVRHNIESVLRTNETINKFATPEKDKKSRHCDNSLPTTRFSSITERSINTANECTPVSNSEKIVFPHPYILTDHLSPKKQNNGMNILNKEQTNKKHKHSIPLLNLELTQKNSVDSHQNIGNVEISNRINNGEKKFQELNSSKRNIKLKRDWEGVNILILTASHDRIIQKTKAKMEQLTLYTKQSKIEGNSNQNFYIIEEGSFGKVYKGRYNNSDVAIKIPNLATMETDPFGVTERILREWRLLAKIKHPNIIGLKGGIILPNRQIWLLTNYINGCDLHSLRYRYNMNIPIEKSIRMVKQLVGVLDFLHTPSMEKGIIIHRDIKPENIIVDCANWDIFLCDFGDAEEIGSGNKSKLSGATWLYSPIELLSSDPMKTEGQTKNLYKYDEKWDIWSLGCVLQEFFGHSNPFEHIVDYTDSSGQIYSKLVKAVRENKYTPLIPNNIHPLLRKIITICLQADPRLRPTAKGILKILSQLD